MRGLRGKLIDLRQALLTVSYDVIIFTETWLNSSFHSSELGFLNYNIFRSDRNANTSLRSSAFTNALGNILDLVLINSSNFSLKLATENILSFDKHHAPLILDIFSSDKLADTNKCNSAKNQNRYDF